LKLLRAPQEKRPIELLNSVEKHLRRKPEKTGKWHWRTDTPFDALPAQRDLLVDTKSAVECKMEQKPWISKKPIPQWCLLTRKTMC